MNKKLILYNFLTTLTILGISVLAVYISWISFNPVTATEKAITTFGSIITLWITIHIIYK